MILFLSNLSAPLSSSGYDTASRNAAEIRKQDKPRQEGRAWKRRNPYDFTGCLAHAHIVERESDGAVSSIAGFFNHNELCQQSVMKCLPAVPLHPHVYEVAIAQLEGGSRCVCFSVQIC